MPRAPKIIPVDTPPPKYKLDGRRKPRPSNSPDLPLSEMQRAFVHHLVHNKMTQVAAMRAAGCTGTGAAQIANKHMRNPRVQAAIAKARAEYAVASGITKKKIIDGFLEAIDMGRLKADPISMIAGWREVGKMCGFYEPTKTKVEISVNGQVMVQRLQNMTDEELLALSEAPVEAIEGEFTVDDA